jgi:short-subunit dehydrogenase
MRLRLKALAEQTIVLTGATSGIGLATARLAAARGARLVLAARDEDALQRLGREIDDAGGQTRLVVCDVGDEADVKRLCDEAISAFGGFDTWINNAGVSIYGRMIEVATEDHRRLFETNFWGVVYGSLAAARHFANRASGAAGASAAALINVGSVVSDRAVPLQGMYSASKHAVKGLTDALRMELEHDRVPVSVTLIKPAAIDTPYPGHARNYLPQEPSLPPPVYGPRIVARAILHAATRPKRDVLVGGAGRFFSLMSQAPRLGDRYMNATMFRQQTTGQPRSNRVDGLFAAAGGLEERGRYEGHVARTSLYTQASLHPFVTGAVLGATGLVAAGLVAGRNIGRRDHGMWARPRSWSGFLRS